MIKVQANEKTKQEFAFGYLHVLHHHPTQIRLVASGDGDHTRTKSTDLSPDEQVSVADQPIFGQIKLSNLSEFRGASLGH